MLLASRRHSTADLALWREHADADLIHAERASFARRVNEASAALREFVIKQPPCYCGTSWGKDSVVVCHLLREIAPRVPLMHLRPTNHNPDCDAVRDAYFLAFPGQSYVEVPVCYDGIDRISTPRHELDKLTDQRWYAAINGYAKAFDGRHILGIRAEESMGRRFRMMRWGLNSPNASAPIGRWSTADVFAYLESHNLPTHPVYAMLGGGRWKRDRLRTAEIGDTHGTGGGRAEWEKEYYSDVLNRLAVGKK